MPAEFFVILLLERVFLKMAEGKTNVVSIALSADHLCPPHTHTLTHICKYRVSVGKVPFLSGRDK